MGAGNNINVFRLFPTIRGRSPRRETGSSGSATSFSNEEFRERVDHAIRLGRFENGGGRTALKALWLDRLELTRVGK